MEIYPTDRRSTWEGILALRPKHQSVRQGLCADLDEAILIGAYHEKNLLGFIKLFVADRYAMDRVMLILDKMTHRA